LDAREVCWSDRNDWQWPYLSCFAARSAARAVTATRWRPVGGVICFYFYILCGRFPTPHNWRIVVSHRTHGSHDFPKPMGAAEDCIPRFRGESTPYSAFASYEPKVGQLRAFRLLLKYLLPETTPPHCQKKRSSAEPYATLPRAMGLAPPPTRTLAVSARARRRDAAIAVERPASLLRTPTPADPVFVVASLLRFSLTHARRSMITHDATGSGWWSSTTSNCCHWPLAPPLLLPPPLLAATTAVATAASRIITSSYYPTARLSWSALGIGRARALACLIRYTLHARHHVGCEVTRLVRICHGGACGGACVERSERVWF
jgi:hypothetical protein